MTLPQLKANLLAARPFLVAQLFVVSVLLWIAFLHRSEHERASLLPSLRDKPLSITPNYDYPFIISDQQLADVLGRLQPRLGDRQPQINELDHALRLWGDRAGFDDDRAWSGNRMRTVLLDHREFQSVWGKQVRPLLIDSGDGIALRTQQGKSTTSHTDHTLATLAEIGTPLDQQVVTSERTTTVRQLITHALADFRLNQPEYEWTVLACALYAPTDASWRTTEGQQISYDRLAHRIMRSEMTKGCCLGQHRLYTLAVLLRIDDQRDLLSPETRIDIEKHLLLATKRLVENQHSEGYWDENWAQAPPASAKKLKPVARRLLATGHALEWWAIAPRKLHPPREVLVRAGQWLVHELTKLDQTDIDENYTFLSHVGRALCLWRGGSAAELFQRLEPLQP